MVCAACGSENRPGSRFCDQCGSPLALSCPACGEPNRADARYCVACGASIGTRAAVEHPRAERRVVSVLFVDLVGFTEFADGRDAEEVRAVQQRYFDLASDVVARHGGMVEKFVGDAVMAVWGTPVAHEDDASRAVRAGLEIVGAVDGMAEELRARAGIVTAEAAVTIGGENQAMVAGDMVNTASRLQVSAEGGQVLADRATVQAALEAITFEPLDERLLKGKAGPMRAWRALRTASAPSAGEPERMDEGAVEPPFVNRDDELRLVRELLEGVRRDRQIRLVSIVAPAGIGKTRLVNQLARSDEGASWLFGRSPSYGEGLAFWPLGEMVRRRAGLAETDDPDETRARVRALLTEVAADDAERDWVEPALLSLLGLDTAAGGESVFPAWRTLIERIAASSGAVLVFEDLQWADSGTLDFIEHLLDWSRSQPILIVTIARPELLDVRPRWGTARSSSTSLALGPLSDESMTRLLSGLLPGLPAAQLATIVQRAEGMPLYAVEVVRGLLADGRVERQGDAYHPIGDLGSLPIPASLRSLIASRLDALGVDDRALLQHAAVLGRSFAADALSAVSGRLEEELEPALRSLVRRELLQVEADPQSPERGQYRFVQSLIREVAYDTLVLRERRSRHLAAARFLEATGADELAGALASHYLAAFHVSQAGPEADAVAAQACVTLCAAADRAAGLGSHDQAITSLRHALALASSDEERADLLERITISAQAAASPEAPEVAEQALAAYRAAGDVDGVARMTAVLGDVLLDAGRVNEGASVLRQAMAELGPPAVWGEREAFLHAMLARAHMRLDENEEALAAADRALIVAERLNLDRIAATALVNKGSALTQLGRTREAIALLEGGIRLAERGGWTHLELRARVNLGTTLSDDEPVRAQEIHLAGAEAARRIGDRSMFATLASSYAGEALTHGTAEAWNRAAAMVDEALDLEVTPGDRVGLLRIRAYLLAARGEDATAVLEEIDRLSAEAIDPRWRVISPIVRAELDLIASRYSDAIDRARQAAELDRFATGTVAPVVLHAAILSGQREPVRWLADRFEELPHSGRFSEGTRRHIAAADAALGGRADEAIDHFAAALELYRSIEAHWEWARTALDAVVALPDHRRTRAWAAEARNVFAEIGVRPYLAILDDVLERDAVGARVAPATAEAAATIPEP
jgi:predicted ATPase/class 3 adenylate cyclase